jgi:hypothetical protein
MTMLIKVRNEDLSRRAKVEVYEFEKLVRTDLLEFKEEEEYYIYAERHIAVKEELI